MPDPVAICRGAWLSVVLWLPVAAVAEPPGRAGIDEVIPDAPRSVHSGSPADWPEPVHDDALFSQILIDRFEYRDSFGASNAWLWDAQGWLGSDENRFWWKSEGEGPISGGGPDSSDLQLLYSRMISPFWNLQAGVRQSFNPDPDRRFAVVGLQGLAPLLLETDTALYISDEGDISASAEFEYEMLLTQRLILQPRLALAASLQDVPRYDTERGMNRSEAGLRLRYELRREFAPYVGISHERDYDHDESTTALVMGLRAWY
ncbi:copper resistance protein B [Halomonas sp. HP20-15]|uniref:copper resistance protein B n=1 Tax=Halomonas sp. HP20-15 TaxID=3085901 RepID=UPI002981183C|nr:copper resistance protein B [Halomonas sp. HP20-15]MDW5376525.1 copper resistance protein B [Halomonas sp. HP20-15]